MSDRKPNQMYPAEGTQYDDYLLEDFSDSKAMIGEYTADLSWLEIDPSLSSIEGDIDLLIVIADQDGISVVGDCVSFNLSKTNALQDDRVACLKYIEDNIKAPINYKELLDLGFKRD